MKIKSKFAIIILIVFMSLGIGVAIAASLKIISIATGPTGGTYYIIGAGMAKIIEKYVPKIRVSAESTGGTIENIRLVGTKQAQFGIAMPDGAYFAYHSGREFKDKGYPNLRSVMNGHSSSMHFLVRANSGIKSLADLRGKRVALSGAGSTAVFVAEAALEAYGLTKKDYESILLTYQEQVTAIRDGTIDMACIFAGAPVSSVLDLTSTHDMVLLSVGPRELKKVLENNPYYTDYVIKAGTYKGQNADIRTIAGLATLITYAELEPELVYVIAKAILEHTPELKEIHPAGAEWDLADAAEGVAIPFHPGAEKYLREKGVLKK